MPGHRSATARTRMTLVATSAALILAGCASVDGPGPTSSPSLPSPSATAAATSTAADTCPEVDAVAPSGPSARAVVAQDATDDSVRVEMLRYPRPDGPGNPWSHWGQGLVTPDGRFFSAIGNHLGADGNSYVFVHDPETQTTTRFADLLSLADDPSWGYGKVHGQIVPGDCGEAFLSTYWGTRDELEYSASYRGDLLVRLDTTTLDLESLGTVVEERGTPSLAGGDGIVFGEAVDPYPARDLGRDQGTFFAYDTASGTLVHRSDSPAHLGFRNVLVAADGTAYVAGEDGALLAFRAGSDELQQHPERLPGGGTLRASTAPVQDGTVFGVTGAPYHFFAMAADGSITDLGPAPGYTTSMAAEPDGSRFYFVPGAHGRLPELGSPVVAFDTATGEQSTLARLDDLAGSSLGLHTSGSYSVVLDADRRRLHVMLNAGPASDSRWGEVVLATVHLPDDGPPASAATATAIGRCTPQSQLATVYGLASDGRAQPVRLTDATGRWGATEPLTGMYGHAVATADVNQDGWVDLFVGTFADRPIEDYAVRGADGPSPDRLLLGGPGGFTVDDSFPGTRGRTSGAAFGDLDADGDPDLVLARNVRDGERASAPSTVLRNDDGQFVEVATLTEPQGARSIGLLDADADGLLDLFITEDRFSGGSSVLLRNDGRFTFSDVTDSSGLPADLDGLGVGTGDLTGDDAPDLVVGGSNRVFVNDGTGRFREAVGAIEPWATYGNEDDPAGVALGDVNTDGRLDVVIGQHFNSTIDAGQSAPVRLYLNETSDGADLRLREVTEAAGLEPLATKSPHVDIADLDADGRPDIVTTAVGTDGRPVVFGQVAAETGVPRFRASASADTQRYWVTGAVTDLDRDGRLDVVSVEWEPGRPTTLWRSAGSTGHWLAVAAPTGSHITVHAAGQQSRQSGPLGTAQVGTSTGYAAGPSDRVWFGLGDVTSVDLSVRAPGSPPLERRGVAVDRLVTCR